MKTLESVLLILHIIGVGALLSGFFSQLKNMKTGMTVNGGIIHGAWIMLVTGFAMAGIIPVAEPDVHINNIVLGLKSIVITAIFFIAYSFSKKDNAPKWVVPVIALLTITNISLAVLGPIVNG